MLTNAVASSTSDARSSLSRGPLGFSLAVATLCVCLSASAAAAQEAQSAGDTKHPPHRFFDALNITLTGVESADLTADGIYTQRGLKHYAALGAREADPIARPFVSRGWPGQIAGGTLFVAADVGLRYLLHRKKHHLLERLLPLVLTVYGADGAIHNARVLHRADKAR